MRPKFLVWMTKGGGIIHCEKGYDEFGFGEVELEMPVEFLFLLLQRLKYEFNIRIPSFPPPQLKVIWQLEELNCLQKSVLCCLVHKILPSLFLSLESL